jgi:hypothetical protein
MFVFLFERRMVSQECPQIVKRCTLLVVGILYGYLQIGLAVAIQLPENQ